MPDTEYTDDQVFQLNVDYDYDRMLEALNKLPTTDGKISVSVVSHLIKEHQANMNNYVATFLSEKT